MGYRLDKLEKEGPTLDSLPQNRGNELVFTLLRTSEARIVWGVGNHRMVRWGHVSVSPGGFLYIALKSCSSVVTRLMAESRPTQGSSSPLHLPRV